MNADEVVSVELWRGYVTGCFYARPADRDAAIAVSPAFRILRLPWESRVPLERHRSALGAFAVLGKMLVETGWHPVAGRTGARWYQRSFSRKRPGAFTPPRPPRVVRRAPADTNGRPVDPPPDDVTNGHPADSVAGEIVTALSSGPLASSELYSRVGRSAPVVRAVRTELEQAGLVQKASPPPGRSRRATYWKLSRGRADSGRTRSRDHAG